MTGWADVIGALFSCVNTGTMRVAVLGTYTIQRPTAAAWQSLTRLLASIAAVLQLYLAVIGGHRDSARNPPRIEAPHSGFARALRRPATNSYDTRTLESAPLPISAGASLSFQSWFETENPTTVYDEKYLQASADGRPGHRPLQISGQPRAWINHTVALPAATLNRLPGWYLDKIALKIN